MSTSESWLLKYTRGSEHVEELRFELEWFINSSPAAFTFDDDAETGEQFFYMERVDNVPAKFSVLIGDSLQDFRSALDHMVYELDTRPISEREADTLLCFPIFLKKPKGDAWRKRTGSIGATADAALNSLQPHIRSQPNPSHDPLWWLHELARIDRHRRLHFGVWKMEGSGLMLGDHTFKAFPASAIEVGTEIARFDPADVSDPNVKFSLSVGISFMEEPVRDQNILSVLQQIRDNVYQALETLKPHLPT